MTLAIKDSHPGHSGTNLRAASHRLQALLRQNVTIRVYNCHRICNALCYTDIIRCKDEVVEIEAISGTANLLMLKDHLSHKIRVFIEISLTHESMKTPHLEPWFQSSASEIVNPVRYRENILHLNEHRSHLPISRKCMAHTFHQQVWLAGYHKGTIRSSDTLDKTIVEQWKIDVITGSEDDPLFPEVYRTQLRLDTASKASKIQLYADHYPDAYDRTNWCQNAKQWAKLWITSRRTVRKAREHIKATRKCIGCYQSVDPRQEQWKILCLLCWKQRVQESESYTQ